MFGEVGLAVQGDQQTSLRYQPSAVISTGSTQATMSRAGLTYLIRLSIGVFASIVSTRQTVVYIHLPSQLESSLPPVHLTEQGSAHLSVAYRGTVHLDSRFFRMTQVVLIISSSSSPVWQMRVDDVA